MPAVVPPVGELVFDEPPGDVHVKYGYIKRDDYYVIKVASGFYDNPKLGLPSGDGLMLLFSQRTGVAVQDIQISKAVWQAVRPDVRSA